MRAGRELVYSGEVEQMMRVPKKDALSSGSTPSGIYRRDKSPRGGVAWHDIIDKLPLEKGE